MHFRSDTLVQAQCTFLDSILSLMHLDRFLSVSMDFHVQSTSSFVSGYCCYYNEKCATHAKRKYVGAANEFLSGIYQNANFS